MLNKKNMDLLHKLVEEKNKPLSNYDYDDYIDIYKTLQPSLKVFANIKTDLGRYIIDNKGNAEIFNSIKFEDIKPYLSLNTTYFKNFKALDNTLTSLVRALTPYNHNQYQTFVVCAYLAWFGIPIEIASDITKQMVQKDDDIIGLPDGTYVALDSKAMEYIRDYCYVTSYTTVTVRGKGYTNLDYKPSKYLLRTFKSDHLTKSNIQQLFNNFNNSVKSEITFSYKKIYLSGIYYRLHLEVCKGVTLPDLYKHCPSREDVNIWCNLLRIPQKNRLLHKVKNEISQYQQWCDFFYEEGR